MDYDLNPTIAFGTQFYVFFFIKQFSAVLAPLLM